MARLLAPLALIISTVAVIAIVLGSGAVGGDDNGAENADTRDVPAATDGTTATERQRRRRGRATYTIKANDTLSGIAAANNTTVERLQELNPDLDPQGLVAGQKIKLRE
ncbi:MAG TPA: LysM domain-containing protein [Thermoleophilaceae bacterium]|nr:LysM domain-containing protein [Thermoleophilaceae bacterium]